MLLVDCPVPRPLSQISTLFIINHSYQWLFLHHSNLLEAGWIFPSNWVGHGLESCCYWAIEPLGVKWWGRREKEEWKITWWNRRRRICIRIGNMFSNLVMGLDRIRGRGCGLWIGIWTVGCRGNSNFQKIWLSELRWNKKKKAWNLLSPHWTRLLPIFVEFDTTLCVPLSFFLWTQEFEFFF